MDRATLDRALDSAAAQTWPAIEIVVIAACGSRHRALPGQWRGRPLRLVGADASRTLPRPAAANLGLEHARGQWLNFLDDDDELLPTHVATLLGAPRADDELVLYSRCEVVDAEGRVTGRSGVAGFHAQLVFQNRAALHATMLHRRLVDDGVRFDPAFEIFEDRDFMIACATRTAFRFVDAVTCRWHAHIGESGLGHGDNARRDREAGFTARLQQKWQAVFARWMAAPEAQLFLGQHYLRHEGAARALPYLEAALARVPDDINALNLCGMANLGLGRLERAEQLLAQALARLPGHAGLQHNLALVDAAMRARSA